MTLHERLVGVSFRGPGFDHIRIAAATAVLLHHCRHIEYADIRDDVLFRYSDGFIHFGLLAVTIFFAISGFLVTPGLVRSGSVIDFTASRILRIFPGLIVIVAATMMMVGAILTTHSLESYYSDPMLYRYAKNVLTLTNNFLPGVTVDNKPTLVNGALWTLHFEILSYAALALLSMLGFLRRRGLFLIAFVVSYGMYLAMSVEPDFAALLPSRFATFIGLFVYFSAGAALSLFSDRIPFSIPLCCLALMSIMMALPFGLGPVVMPIALSYIMVFLGLSALPGKSLLKRDISYGIYLIHGVVLTGFQVLFPEFRIWWLAALMIFSVTAMLAYLSWNFVEGPALGRKKALSNWLNGRLNPRRPSRAKVRLR